MKVNFGERLYSGGSGFVYGEETDRLVAKFSHSQEAESFVASYNEQYEGDLWPMTQLYF